LTNNRKINDKYNIITKLRSLGLFDSQLGINQRNNITWLGPTIDNKQAKSRIDHIWISRDLIQDRICVNTIFDDLFNSDHALVTLTLSSRNIINFQNEKNTSTIKRTIFNYNNMNKQDWQEYKEYIDNLIVSRRIKEKYLDIKVQHHTWLNALWEEIKSIFTEARNQKGKTKTIIRSEKTKFDDRINNKDYNNII
jgi:hypothetical protein